MPKQRPNIHIVEPFNGVVSADLKLKGKGFSLHLRLKLRAVSIAALLVAALTAVLRFL